jgi:hypothetical protein
MDQEAQESHFTILVYYKGCNSGTQESIQQGMEVGITSMPSLELPRYVHQSRSSLNPVD